jgi:effector-binding domain-containing protein
VSSEPRIVERPAQPYVGIRDNVSMQNISAFADRLPSVFAWLAAHAIPPAGAPFFKYNVIDMEHELEMEAGVPVSSEPEVDGDLVTGVLPAGRYATVSHVGHPAELVDVTGRLLRWAANQGLEFDVVDERWGCRIEVYNTDPATEPDMSKWETDLFFRLAS